MRTDRGRQRFYAAGWVISAGVMVVASRVWRLHLREVEQRAEEAERTRDEVARRMAVEERLRIARELHDSLTHNISVICVQSGVAVHLARKRGEEVSPALLAIQEASADAARELRTTLGVLRADEDGDSSGLGHLDSLAARARAAGLPVTVNVTGAKRSLPPEVDQAAYRIVQEALTNVSRHAGQASAWVHLCYTPDALEIQVDDDGAGISIARSTSNATSSSTSNATSSGTSNSTSNATSNGTSNRTINAASNGQSTSNGLGLIGMRERVTALGGRLHAGPRDGGGFQVRAEIPAETPAT
jgi:signal transduction histidine kinase